jgi:hypothetical protein
MTGPPGCLLAVPHVTSFREARSEGVRSLAAPKSGSRQEEVELSGGLIHRSGLTYTVTFTFSPRL